MQASKSRLAVLLIMVCTYPLCAQDNRERNEALIKVYDAAIASQPTSAKLYEGRAGLLRLTGNLDAAIQDYNRSVLLGGGINVVAHRAEALLEQKAYDLAILDLTDVIASGRGDWRTFTNRAIAYSETKELTDALRDINEALRLNGKFGQGYLHRGGIHMRMGNDQLALADFDAMIRLEPDEAIGYRMAAMVRSASEVAEIRDGKRAVEEASKACDMTKWKDDRCIEVLAMALAESNRFAEAQVRLQQAIDLAPQTSPEGRRKKLSQFVKRLPCRLPDRKSRNKE